MSTAMIDARGRVPLAQRAMDRLVLAGRTAVRLAGQVDGTDGEPGTITGTACRYSVPVDRGYGLYLQLEHGCFADQVPYASRVKVLWAHDDNLPMGKLAELADSVDRLRYTGRIEDDPAIEKAASTLALLRAGVIDEVSVGFRILKYTREEDREKDTVTYRILKAHLDELSIVTFGAFGQDATVEDVLSAGEAEALAVVERAARAARLRGLLLKSRTVDAGNGVAG